MRWPREDWLLAFGLTTAPRPPERAVALAYWVLVKDGTQVAVATKDLAPRCGLSRAAAHDAVRYLVATGWLTPVGVPKSGRTVPHELTIGRDADARLEGHQRARRPVGEVVQDDLSPVGEVVQDDREVWQDDFSRVGPISPTGTPPPTRADAVDALWLVVVGGLPSTLGHSLARTTRINDALGRHHDEGWTPETLAAAVVAKDWTGARGGLVNQWLEIDLQKPSAVSAMPTKPGRPPLCGECDERWVDTPLGVVHCPRCGSKSGSQLRATA